MKINKRFVAIDNVCAWPQLRLSKNGNIFMTGFNKPCHGRVEGDVDCWLSKDNGEFFNYVGTPVIHEATENRMNHCSGFTNNGDFIAIVSGYSNKPKEIIEDDEKYLEHFKKSRTLIPIIARSSDNGKTYKNTPLQFENLASIIPFGEIEKINDTTLICSVYLVGTKETKSFYDNTNRRAGVLISYDDGYTWNDFFVIDENINETSIAVLENKIIAVARTAKNQHLVLYESFDEGKTWRKKEDLTLLNQIPASITVLNDKRVLVTYGCRNNQKSISYRIGDKNAENFEEPVILQVIDTNWDMGYPSTIQVSDGTLVTGYYTSKNTNHYRYHIGIIKWEL